MSKGIYFSIYFSSLRWKIKSSHSHTGAYNELPQYFSNSFNDPFYLFYIQTLPHTFSHDINLHKHIMYTLSGHKILILLINHCILLNTSSLTHLPQIFGLHPVYSVHFSYSIQAVHLCCTDFRCLSVTELTFSAISCHLFIRALRTCPFLPC